MKVGKHNSKKKFEIFKIQRPLVMIGTSVLVLVYNYVRGYIDSSDMLQVVEKTTARNW